MNILDKCTTVVLVGGQAKRFGELGFLLPKGLLPVSEEQTLLSRNLDFLVEAGVSKVIISTSPENYSVFQFLLNRYLQLPRISNQNTKIELVQNEAHHYSSLTGFYEISKNLPSEYCMMYLGDMFFLENPLSWLRNSADINLRVNWILSCSSVTLDDLKRGGLALVEDGICRELFLKKDSITVESQRFHSWSGIALFNEATKCELSQYVNTINSKVEEDFINYCINRGRIFYNAPLGRFINVNSYSDYVSVLQLSEARS